MTTFPKTSTSNICDHVHAHIQVAYGTHSLTNTILPWQISASSGENCGHQRCDQPTEWALELLAVAKNIFSFWPQAGLAEPDKREAGIKSARKQHFLVWLRSLTKSFACPSFSLTCLLSRTGAEWELLSVLFCLRAPALKEFQLTLLHFHTGCSLLGSAQLLLFTAM